MPWQRAARVTSTQQQRRCILLATERATGTLVSSNAACMMLEWCNLSRHLMSTTVVDALDLAHRYWRGEATRNDMDQMRVACWKELDAMELNSRHLDPRYLAARAVICVLFPDFPDGVETEGGHMYFCLDFANRAEDHSLEQKQLLLREFEDA